MSHSSNLIEENIEQYLATHENKDMLRFLTCGNVDDGKSTLIGRLLFDSKLIYEDQMAAIEKDSHKFNTTNQDFDLSLLVDGLQAEREQGITIDVAYRYFSTDKRKFIIADTPGHEQYTRNMVTGASTCDLAIVIVDARYGVQEQTRRHSYICSLLGIKHIFVAINKMDLVGYSQETYQKIKKDYRAAVADFTGIDIRFIPISALLGDNIVTPSEHMDWYPGATLIKLLETVKIDTTIQEKEMRFPVQYVTRPSLDFRGFCGTIESGWLSIGDQIVALPSNKKSTIKNIYSQEGETSVAYAGSPITITLDNEIDVSRGDMIIHSASNTTATNSFAAHIVWMDELALRQNKEYLFKFSVKTTVGHVANFIHTVNINTMEKDCNQSRQTLDLNEIALAEVNLVESIVVDRYEDMRNTGAFIIIDRVSNATVGVGMVYSLGRDSKDAPVKTYSEAEKALNAYVREHFPEWGCVDITL